MRAEASTLPAGSDATASYSDGVMSFGIPRGQKGDTGSAGPGVPAGGSSGDILTKTGSSDYQTGWTAFDDLTTQEIQGIIDEATGADPGQPRHLDTLPAGGTAGQVLAKASSEDYDAEWVTPSGGGGDGTSDYTDLSNKPSINGVTLTGNKTAAQLGLGTYSKPSGGIPDSDIASSATWNAKGTYSKPSGGIPASDLASAVQNSLGKADTALQDVPSNYRTAEAQDTIDAGKADKVIEVTISTAGAVTQALDAGTIYHFTGALTSLSITAADPMTGKYQFDFRSGSTAPTLTVPASWVMPDNFIVEPSARYSLSIRNGYCSLEKWSDSHSPFIYLDDDYGDFIINSNALINSPNAYANVGTEVSLFSISGRLKSELGVNANLKLCDISARAKSLMGSTYVTATLSVGNGKVASCIFNTWQSSSQFSIKNDTGAALAANTLVSGTIFILRTL
jgi:hypothetical protein